MKSLNAKEIYGNWATLLLPINADESIDFERLAEEIDFFIESKVDGIYSNGTAGEFYAQTEAEFDRISQLLAEKCEKSNTPFQIGVSHTSAQTSLERLRRAVQLKPGAVQIILPDWVAVTNEEALIFLKKMAENAGDVSLILYNPPHAKRVLSAADLEHLKSEIPQLVGIKVADGDADWYASMRPLAENFSIFVPGHHLATGVSEGVATGAYSNVACLHPKGAQDWWELMKTDLPAALEIEFRIREFMDSHIAPFKILHGYQNSALDKLLAAIGNWANVGTRLRFPYRSIDISEAEKLRSVARAKLPELFPSN